MVGRTIRSILPGYQWWISYDHLAIYTDEIFRISTVKHFYSIYTKYLEALKRETHTQNIVHQQV